MVPYAYMYFHTCGGLNASIILYMFVVKCVGLMWSYFLIEQLFLSGKWQGLVHMNGQQ